jgi:hypothetical protein
MGMCSYVGRLKNDEEMTHCVNRNTGGITS